MLQGASCIGNLQPRDPRMGKSSQNGTGRSAQHAEVHAARLAINYLKKKAIKLLGYIQTHGVCAMAL
jgi:tRNA(Arg) A34 adenosine deaminase TadA